MNAFFGAAAQIGIFTILFVALFSGFFTLKEAAAIGIIGGADGPTAIYTTIILADHLLGPVAIAAYSYMALVPIVIPAVVRLLVSKKELKINMKEMDKLYPPKHKIKNIRTVKILFPIILTVIIAIFVPSALPLAGMLLFGNLLKESGRGIFIVKALMNEIDFYHDKKGTIVRLVKKAKRKKNNN